MSESFVVSIGGSSLGESAHVRVQICGSRNYFSSQRKRPRSNSSSERLQVSPQAIFSTPPSSSPLRSSSTFSGFTICVLSPIQPISMNNEGRFAVPKAKRPKQKNSSQFSSVRSQCLTSKGFPTVYSPVTKTSIISLRLITDILVCIWFFFLWLYS